MPLSPAHVEIVKLLAQLDCELEDDRGNDYDLEQILEKSRAAVLQRRRVVSEGQTQ